MAAPQLPDSTTERRRDRRRLPQLGMPEGGERRRGGIVASLLLHAAILFLMLVPFVGNTTVLQRLAQGAGGEGPAGGGGGGTRGTGGSPAAERVSFARVAPPPPAPPAVSTAVTPPVVQPPKPVTPPIVVPPRPTTPVADNTRGATGPDVSVVPGTGGGTGSDGTAGSGPGSGGGVGSGVGTGRGSGTGPGTGGGTAENFPPQPMELYLPPEPRPSRVKGTQVIAEFDVDASGKVLGMTFTETPDGGYNRKLRDMLRSITRFRPGTRPDGTPVRMKAQITFDL